MKSFLVVLFSLCLFGSLAFGVSVNLGRLYFQDKILEIEKKGDSVIYSVRDLSGALIDAGLEKSELQARFPEIYKKIDGAFASGFIDATNYNPKSR